MAIGYWHVQFKRQIGISITPLKHLHWIYSQNTFFSDSKIQRDKPLSEEKWLGMFPVADEWLDRRMVSCLGIQLAAARHHRWPSGIFKKIFYTIFHWKIFLEYAKRVTGMTRCLWIHLKVKHQRWPTGIFKTTSFMIFHENIPRIWHMDIRNIQYNILLDIPFHENIPGI